MTHLFFPKVHPPAERGLAFRSRADLPETHDRLIIGWRELDKAESLAGQGTGLLKQRNHEKGIAILRLALQRDLANTAALFNLGMALGDGEDAGEGLKLLRRLVTLEPDRMHIEGEK